jgi:DNA modification methylase
MTVNTLYNTPCEEGIQLLKDSNVFADLICCSPPYNVNLGDNKYNKNPYDLYKDNKDHTEYISWLKNIFSDCQDILKEGATVCINIGDGKNGGVPTHSDIIQFMSKDLNYIPVTTIIWDKGNCSSRTSWGSWQSPSNPSFPTPFEYILIFRYKDRNHTGNKEDITVTRDEFITNSLAIWKFGTEKLSKVGHPAAFPLELPKRCIQQLTYKGDLVIDIFSGAGTTAMAAKGLCRQYIGFELSAQYHALANQRISTITEGEFLSIEYNNTFSTKLF